MSRVQLALRVSDLEGSIDFYRSLFGVGARPSGGRVTPTSRSPSRR